MHATPELAGADVVLVAYPAGSLVVAIAKVTFPGATSLVCDGIAAAVAKKVLKGKLVPVKLADACGVPSEPPINVPVEMTLAGFLLIRNRPSPCVPGPLVAATLTTVDPVVHPVAHVPPKTRLSSVI
jgi:hypothetical protein